MKKILLLILFVLIGCENLIKESEEEEKSDIEIARENILGNWHTQNPTTMSCKGDNYEDSLYISFDEENFNLTAFRPFYPYLNELVKNTAEGSYYLDNDSTFIVDIINFEPHQSLTGFDGYCIFKWKKGKTYFWNARSFTESRLELCFEVIDQTDCMYNYYYYFTRP